MVLRMILGTLFFGLVLSGCQTTSSAQKQTPEHAALEECLLNYGSKNRSNLSPQDASVSCGSEIQAFLKNPGFEVKPGTTGEKHWATAINVIGLIIKPNGKKSSIAYSTHGPIVGKWWAHNENNY